MKVDDCNGCKFYNPKMKVDKHYVYDICNRYKAEIKIVINCVERMSK